jgi:hypothetical protein
MVSANLLLNSDFSTDDGSGWAQDWERGNDYHMQRVNWGTPPPHSADWYTVFEGWEADGWGWFAQSAQTNMTQDEVVQFSVWSYAENDFASSTDEGYITIEFYDGSAAKLGEESFDIYSAMTGTRNAYVQHTVHATNTFANVASVKAVVGSGGWVGGGSASLAFDDADLTIQPIPEPSSLVLMLLASLLVGVLRKVRR